MRIDPTVVQSAVLAVIPAVEPLVGGYRQALDPSAPAGVPAHVTVLYPFVPPPSITDGAVERLRAAVRGSGAIDCSFDGIGWFGDDYVWLAPSPSAPFVALTERVHRAVPDHPPYAGEHDGEHPHLTVGARARGTLDELQEAAAAIAASLPVRARVDRLHLLVGSDDPGSWHAIADLPLDGS